MNFTCLVSFPTICTFETLGLEPAAMRGRHSEFSHTHLLTLPEARRDYAAVCEQWTASRVRSRRAWRRWSEVEPALTGVDPFADFDMTEREAFAALTSLAKECSEAFAAWCWKARRLWEAHFRTAHGRRLADGVEGASLGALVLGMNRVSRAALVEKPYPFKRVMCAARHTERRRGQEVESLLNTVYASAGPPAHDAGVESLVEMIDLERLLRGAGTDLPTQLRRQRLEHNVEHLIRWTLGESDRPPGRTGRRTRSRLAALRSGAAERVTVAA